MEVKDDKLLQIEQFFNLNLRVKKLLNDLAPTELDFYDEETRYKYKEKLYSLLDKIVNDMTKMLNIYGSVTLESFKVSMEDLLTKISSREFDITMQNGYFPMLNFYNTYISNMRPEFVESVNKGFIGYYMYYGDGVLKPNTINEYLHYVHSMVINSDHFYSSVPIVNTTKKTENDCNSISLRGKESELGKELFDKIVEYKINSDCIDIINLKDKMLIMARDLGHAAVIQIDTSDLENIFVKYFIPKNTCMEKAQKLKGVKTCNERFMVGDFMTNKDNLSKELCDFMAKIPTDADIRRERNM